MRISNVFHLYHLARRNRPSTTSVCFGRLLGKYLHSSILISWFRVEFAQLQRNVCKYLFSGEEKKTEKNTPYAVYGWNHFGTTLEPVLVHANATGLLERQMNLCSIHILCKNICKLERNSN